MRIFISLISGLTVAPGILLTRGAGKRLWAASLCLAVLVIAEGASCLGQTQQLPVPRIIRLLREGNYQSALALTRQLQKSQSGDPHVWTLTGIALQGLGRKEGALKAFRRALSLSGGFLPALEGAAQIEYQENPATARNDLERIIQIDPDNGTAHGMLGALAFRRKDCTSAIDQFRAAASILRTQPAALREFGVCLLEDGQPSAAVTTLEQVVDLAPEDAFDRYTLGVAQYAAHRYADAIETIKPLAAAQSPSATVMDLLGDAHEKNHQTALAVAALRRAVLLSPHYVPSYVDMALICLDHGSFQVGIDFLNAGLREVPNSAALHTARGVLYVQLGQFEKAQADFDEAARINPNQNFSHVAMGITLLESNHLGQSLEAVKIRLVKTPNDPVLNYLLAEVLLRKGVHPGSPAFLQAIAAARKAVKLDPGLVLARDDLAQLDLEAGKMNSAIEQSHLALRVDPKDQTAVYHLIVAYRRTGELQKAAALTKDLARLAAQSQREQAVQGRYRLVE